MRQRAVVAAAIVLILFGSDHRSRRQELVTALLPVLELARRCDGTVRRPD
jgi:hypothetical protein